MKNKQITMSKERPMKQSGIPWIGEIPEGWEIGRIKNQFSIFGGSTPTSDNPLYWDGEISWITPADMADFGTISSGRRFLTNEGFNACGVQMASKGDIIISTRAPIGKVNICKNNICTNQGCKTLSNRKDDNRFVAYYIFSLQDVLNNLGKGTTFLELSAQELSVFPILLPPLPEQTAIANFLDDKYGKIDILIENEEKTIIELKEYKKSIIQKALMSNSGWKVARVKNFVESANTGISITKEYWDENGNVLLYTAGQKPIQTNYQDFPQELLTTDKDILVARNGAGAIQIPKLNSTYTDHVIRFILRPSINRKFVYYVLSNCVERIAGEANDVSLKTLSKSTWYEQSFYLPPLPEQKSIADYLDKKTKEVDSLIAIKQQKIAKLKEYKKSIIYEYVTGKKEVSA